MDRPDAEVCDGVLLLAAAPREAEAVARAFDQPWSPTRGDGWEARPLTARWSLVETGVGKVNAACAAAACADPQMHRAVLVLGVAGVLPGCDVGLLDVVAASASVYADEGLATDDGFRSVWEMGFAPGPFDEGGIPGSPALLDRLTPLADAVGPIATVSTCAGTDARAAAVARRTGALAEGMEGAAAGHAVRRLFSDGIMFAEVRVISNTTGSRDRQRWDLAGALHRLTELTRAIAGAW